MKLIFLVLNFIFSFVITANADNIPTSVLSQIKAKAAREFPHDHIMQKYAISIQEKAFLQLKSYRNFRFPPSVFLNIKEKALRAFPEDYCSQKDFMDKQENAYLAIQYYKAPATMDQHALKTIKHIAARDFPDDYYIQNYVIDTQVSYYLSGYRLSGE